MKKDLSVIILSYNTKDLTKRCILTLLRCLRQSKDLASEVIVLDNASSDGSVKMLKHLQSKNKELKLILSKKNLGFAKGNNQALKIAQGKYILFLNSDVIIQNVNFRTLINYLDKHSEIGVLTVNVVLPDGNIDPASHRGFPTLWNSLCYFSGLEKLSTYLPFFNKIFGGYHLVGLNLNSQHEIDAPSGAFYLSKRKLLDQMKGFDEAFFFYGEDIDLSFRIKKLGYKIIYYPVYKVLHLKRASGLEKRDRKIKNRTRYHFYDAMKIFYKKHYEKLYPTLLNRIVYLMIDKIKNQYA
ncbi:hypothetical protein A2954_05850 [Candidatus Roizmanbacteria bacterium RIFCSPLOWO2_01_FULL_37_12]|uniref:Glycosyltransferase 2-like domain-containing protein n=1 Tax=Candidatus Roizmanbacteria bacterium RIFCSPLOWO2_01_FULL_37_12 TaxID=1802056 RepID=A0A1F7IBU3_9BACT|nr:MAG: hypothetical protein A2768_02590 [Candidatus Roizmanbacteria bacterium RIFCSPHIGHO2_01_FULL_37_16]OGK40829.1 MAG: hypothetical protein A2954_05850 [Candidatus Roizmanbacteria bacterium RIFCSPLOWO2_01_FULL_37_12]